MKPYEENRKDGRCRRETGTRAGLCRQILWTALASASILYGFCVLAAGSGTAFFAVWFVLGAVFLFLAFSARRGLWKKLPGGIRAVVLAVILAGLVFFTAIEAMILGSFGQRAESGLDCIIVLGAQVYESGPSIVLKYRLDAACSYLRENPDTVCVVSGGRGPNEPRTEAEVMREYLLEQGIPEERILTEDRAQNTQQNIRFSMELIDPEEDSVGIVTNNFHVFRGCALARKAGIRDVSGISAPTKALYLPNNLFREFFGVVKDWLQGNLALRQE